MQKNFFLPMMVLIAVLLTGAVGKYYIHEQRADGSAVLTLFWKTVALGDVDYGKLAEVCAQKEYACSADWENFSISVELEKGKYYRFYADYGFADIVYTLELDAIATDALTAKTIDALNAAGQPVVFGADEPTELTKQDREFAEMLRKTGDIYYFVQMPGEVSETNTGERSGNTVTFTLSQAYMKDGSVVIKSRQLNALYVVGALLVLALLAVSVYFVKEKQKIAPPPKPYAPKKPRAARKR